jgi:hypothetical protein
MPTIDFGLKIYLISRVEKRIRVTILQKVHFNSGRGIGQCPGHVLGLDPLDGHIVGKLFTRDHDRHNLFEP